MLTLLLLVTATAATATKIIPIYEDPVSLRNANDARTILRAWCIDDCHHHILDKPVFIVARSDPNKDFSVNYIPGGLNNLAKSPLTAPLHEHILADNKVGVLFNLAKFPFELFPGLLEHELLVPEHRARLSFFYKEAPVIAILNDADFKIFTEKKKGIIQVADLNIDQNGYSIVKDYALINRILPGSSTPSYFARDASPAGLYYVVPPSGLASTPSVSVLQPGGSNVIPLSSQYYRFFPNANPISHSPLLSSSPIHV